jgi:hypothetical protein
MLILALHAQAVVKGDDVPNTELAPIRCILAPNRNMIDLAGGSWHVGACLVRVVHKPASRMMITG